MKMGIIKPNALCWIEGDRDEICRTKDLIVILATIVLKKRSIFHVNSSLRITLSLRLAGLHGGDKTFLLCAPALLQWAQSLGSSLPQCQHTLVKSGQYCCNEQSYIHSVHLPSSLPLEGASSASTEFTAEKAIAKGGVSVCKNQIQLAWCACQGKLHQTSLTWIIWSDLPRADGREVHICLQSA